MIDSDHNVCASLTGILLVQFNAYFRTYRKDALHTRYFVAFVALLVLYVVKLRLCSVLA
jgi:hypothetical protein